MKQRLRFLLSATFVVVVAVLMYVAIEYVARQPLRNDRLNGMRTTLLGIQMYEDSFGHIPQDHVVNSQSVNSWRFQMIPFVTSMKADHDLSRPWNDPSNVVWRNRSIPAYSWSEKSFETNIMGIRGPDSPFRDGLPVKLADLPAACLLVVEVSNSRTHWMESGDMQADRLVDQFSPENDFYVAFADGQVWLLSRNTPLETLQIFCTAKRASDVNRNDLLDAYRIE